MAKKKRRITEKTEEEYEFHPEEFDEREFIYKDIHGTKILFVVMILAIIVGVISAAICFYINESWAWGIATILSFITAIAMKKLLLVLGFRPDLLDAKTMYANYFLFLCLALGICVLFINQPFFT